MRLAFQLLDSVKHMDLTNVEGALANQLRIWAEYKTEDRRRHSSHHLLCSAVWAKPYVLSDSWAETYTVYFPGSQVLGRGLNNTIRFSGSSACTWHIGELLSLHNYLTQCLAVRTCLYLYLSLSLSLSPMVFFLLRRTLINILSLISMRT